VPSIALVGNNPDLHAALLWLRAGTRAPVALSHETALQLYDISDVQPGKIHITIPTAVRLNRELPQPLVIHRADLANEETDAVDGLRATSLFRTLLDLRAAGTSVAIVSAAVDEAARRQLLSKEQRKALQ
jgi:predicted transcriptional regulator of viral defense system